jgi:hypothetical protein
MKICQFCGRNFQDFPDDSCYCSAECAADARDIKLVLSERNCRTCSEMFKTSANEIFCSFECAYRLEEGIEVSLPK